MLQDRLLFLFNIQTLTPLKELWLVLLLVASILSALLAFRLWLMRGVFPALAFYFTLFCSAPLKYKYAGIDTALGFFGLLVAFEAITKLMCLTSKAQKYMWLAPLGIALLFVGVSVTNVPTPFPEYSLFRYFFHLFSALACASALFGCILFNWWAGLLQLRVYLMHASIATVWFITEVWGGISRNPGSSPEFVPWFLAGVSNELFQIACLGLWLSYISFIRTGKELV